MFWTADVLKNEKGTTSFASQSALSLRFSYSEKDTCSNVWRVFSAFPFHPNAFAPAHSTHFSACGMRDTPLASAHVFQIPRRFCSVSPPRVTRAYFPNRKSQIVNVLLLFRSDFTLQSWVICYTGDPNEGGHFTASCE